MLSPEQINLYIANQPEWQRKVLVRLRQLIHSASSDMEEAWRGQTPHFDVAGQPCMSLSTAKSCVSLHFAKGSQFKSTRVPYEACSEDKPARVVKFREGDAIHEAGLTSLIQKAVALNRKQAEAESKEPYTELEGVLRKDPSAWANWQAFPASHRKEYEEWIADGRKEETRKRRIAQALEMIREGATKEERVKGV